MTKVESDNRTNEEIVRSTKEHVAKVREHWENLSPPCPKDDKPGEYVEMLITPPPVTAAKYRCPDGDEFSWREGVGAKLLSDSRHRSD